MSHLSLLTKVLYKPREAFEELKPEITWKDRIFVTFLSLFMGLFVFGGFARLFKITAISLEFGIGNELAAVPILFGLGKTFFILIVGSWFASKIANKFGGTGTFGKTIGMIGYGKILLFLQSMASIVLVGMAIVSTNRALAAAEAGAVVGSFGVLTNISFVIAAGFIIWNLWLQTTAVSVEHEIGFAKSLAAVIIGLAITMTILLMPNVIRGISEVI